MSNASTIRRQISGTQQLTLAPILSATAATETAFQLNNNGLTLTGGGVIPLSAGVTGLYAGTGQVIHIAAAGSFTGLTATETLEFKLYLVTAAQIAAGLTSAIVVSSGIKIADTGSLTPTQTAGGWTIDAFVQLSANGNLTGQFTAEIDFDTVVSPVKLSTDVTGLVGEADLNFVVTALTTTETTGTLVLNELRLDLE